MSSTRLVQRSEFCHPGRAVDADPERIALIGVGGFTQAAVQQVGAFVMGELTAAFIEAVVGDEALFAAARPFEHPVGDLFGRG